MALQAGLTVPHNIKTCMQVLPNHPHLHCLHIQKRLCICSSKQMPVHAGKALHKLQAQPSCKHLALTYTDKLCLSALQAGINACWHAYMHACVHASVHACKHVHACTNACLHSCTEKACMRGLLHASMHLPMLCGGRHLASQGHPSLMHAFMPASKQSYKTCLTYVHRPNS